MADTSVSLRQRLPRIERTWFAIAAILAAVAVFEPANLGETIAFTAGALTRTAPFIAVAVLAVAYLKATGAESLLARAFEGNEARMTLLAALLGGLSPFCSCEVIPFIAAMLGLGVPLSAVMAFWLSSPLMDPAQFAITAGTLGTPFAIGKLVAAVGLGLLGGGVVKALSGTALLADPLKPRTRSGCCGCGPAQPFAGRPAWRFWRDAERRATFRETGVENALFLLKWLTLAYVLEALMLRHVPAEWIGQALGGDGIRPVALGALVGMPAYLNGYAAVPLVDALLAQGMAPGAAMSFMVAGAVSSIPAAIAVWALVRPRVFAAYLGIAATGAVLAGLGWSAIA